MPKTTPKTIYRTLALLVSASVVAGAPGTSRVTITISVFVGFVEVVGLGNFLSTV